MTTKINNKVENHKCFSFGDACHEIGSCLDKKLIGTYNPVIYDLAGMDALVNVRNILCGKVITSFTPIIEIED